ncbi:hypothetical protein GCM10009749_12000 [Agromyces neolithicus]|uniref:CPBP family intramembrane metalloprotease n=1 Tax=Agromyces neolithicus TaxID=269420 RepID=A0ABN2M0N4_9MICO
MVHACLADSTRIAPSGRDLRGAAAPRAHARIALTLAFIRTKNLWVSAGAHIINDWFFITQGVLIAVAVAS